MATSSRKIKKELIIVSIAGLVVVGVLISMFLSNKLNEVVTVEAGRKTLNVSEFIKNEKHTGTFVTDFSNINMNEPGINEIKIKIGKRTYSSSLEIKDTVPPMGKVVNQQVWAKEELEAKDFVEDIVDATDVKVYFKGQPDFNKAGEQKISVILEDTSENKTELMAMLTIIEDTEPPKIEGTKDQSIYEGEKVSYKKGVIVTDNKDENVELIVDSSAVNLKKAGSYKVIYSATDGAGNKETKTREIKVKEKPKNYVAPEEINALADQVLASIIKEGMSDKEKARAIYNWTKNHITYTGYSDKSDWMQGAARGIKKGTGDCFTYYSTSRALLTRAGFENMLVNRDSNDIHFWNLVYVEGGWYHFDTTPSRRGYPYTCFLRTDAEVEEYSKRCKEYFKFDKTKYPATPTKPLK